MGTQRRTIPEQRKCIHELTQTESRFQDALSFPWKRVSGGAFRHFHFSFLGILGSCRPSGQKGGNFETCRWLEKRASRYFKVVPVLAGLGVGNRKSFFLNLYEGCRGWIGLFLLKISWTKPSYEKMTEYVFWYKFIYR